MVVIRAYIAKESETNTTRLPSSSVLWEIVQWNFHEKTPISRVFFFFFFQLCDIKNLELFSKNLANLANNYTKKQNFQFFQWKQNTCCLIIVITTVLWFFIFYFLSIAFFPLKWINLKHICMQIRNAWFFVFSYFEMKASKIRVSIDHFHNSQSKLQIFYYKCT
jgi:hypothetical protein